LPFPGYWPLSASCGFGIWCFDHDYLAVLGGSNAFASLPGIFGRAGGDSRVAEVVILCGDLMEDLAVGSGVLFLWKWRGT